MSAFLDMSNLIKTNLEGVAALSDVTILVDHQKDIASEFNKAIAKIKGGVVTIFFDSYAPAEEEVANSRVISNFVLLVWTKPILRDGATAADDLVSEIHKALQGWVPEGNSCRDKATIVRGRIVPNTRFLIHELRLKIKHHL